MLGVAQCVKKKKTVLEDKAAVVAEQVVSAGDAVPAEATKEVATVQKSSARPGQAAPLDPNSLETNQRPLVM